MESRLQQLQQRVTSLRAESEEVWKTLETAESTLLEMLNAKDYDCSGYFGESAVPASKPPETVSIKQRADRQETEEFYLTVSFFLKEMISILIYSILILMIFFLEISRVFAGFIKDSKIRCKTGIHTTNSHVRSSGNGKHTQTCGENPAAETNWTAANERTTEAVRGITGGVPRGDESGNTIDNKVMHPRHKPVRSTSPGHIPSVRFSGGDQQFQGVVREGGRSAGGYD